MRNKRILSALTIALTAMSFSLSAAAETINDEFTGSISVISSETKEAVVDVICSMNLVAEREAWGLENVDFETLCIGKPINTYEYLKSGFQPCFTMYPLISNNEVVLWARENADGCFGISALLEHDISNYVTEDTEFAIVYDRDGCYTYSDGDFKEIWNFDCESSDRMELDEFESNGNIGLLTSSLSYCEPLNYSGISPLTDTIYECNIKYVPQGHNLCWAAVCASIINYINGTNLTSYDVEDRYIEYLDSLGLSDDYKGNGLNPVYIPNVLDLYGLSYTFGSAPSGPVILSNIKLNHPVYGAFESYDTDEDRQFGHSCTIYGISTTSSYVKIMDPEYGFDTAYIRNGKCTYVSMKSGYLMTLYWGVCYKW